MPLLAPLLAQAVSIAIGDYTEGRMVVNRQDRTYQAETDPVASVSFSNRRLQLSASYSPSLFLAPLEGPDRQLTVVHNASIFESTQLSRKTSLTLSLGASYGKQNPQVTIFSGSGPSATSNSGKDTASSSGAEGSGTSSSSGSSTGSDTGTGPQLSGASAALPLDVRFGSATGAALLNHRISRRAGAPATVGYTASGGVGADSQEAYPLIHGPSATGTYSYQIVKRGTLSTTANTAYTWTEQPTTAGTGASGTTVFSFGAYEGYRHSFNDYFSLGFSAGVIVTRFERDDGTVDVQVSPAFGLGSGLGFRYQTDLWGGTLSVFALAGYAPALDSVRALLDPRITFSAGASYFRERTTVYLNLNSALSLTPNDEGALDAIYGQLGVQQGLSVLNLNGGVRAVWQDFEGNSIVPPSYSVFLGLSWYAPLWGRGTGAPAFGRGASPAASIGSGAVIRR